MLQSMRDLAHSWVVKGLMMLLIVSFGIWGIGDMFRGNPLQKAVATAGSTEISVQELNHAFENTLARARQSFDPNMTPQKAKQMGMLDKTLEGMVKRALVDQDLKRLGIDVSDDEVLKLLGDQPQFRNKDGSFNKDLFRQILAQQHLSEHDFIEQGKQDLSRQQIINALNTGHGVPQTVIDDLYKARAQKRIFDVVTIHNATIENIPPPDDKTLHDFYEQSPQAFTAPEYRSVTIARLSSDDIAKGIPVSDDDLRKEYDKRADELVIPERRDLLQVLVQDELKAKQLAVLAQEKGDLNAVAKNAGLNAVMLEKTEASTLLPELSFKVFAATRDQIIDPIKTPLGWHVIQIKKITPSTKPTFAEVKDKLREGIRRDQAVEQATRFVNRLDDQLAAGHVLEDVADELQLRLIRIPARDSNGATPDGHTPPELPNKDDVLKAAFGQNAGDTSPVTEDKQGNYYVVRTDGVTPSAPKPFDSVKVDVNKAWKDRQQAIKAGALGEKIATALREGKALESFAGETAISIRKTAPVSMLNPTSDPAIPASLASQAFKIKKGEVITAPDSDRLVVARLAAILDADSVTKQDPRKNMIGNEFRQSMNDELVDQYAQYLQTVFKVTTDTALLDRLRQEGN